MRSDWEIVVVAVDQFEREHLETNIRCRFRSRQKARQIIRATSQDAVQYGSRCMPLPFSPDQSTNRNSTSRNYRISLQSRRHPKTTYRHLLLKLVRADEKDRDLSLLRDSKTHDFADGGTMRKIGILIAGCLFAFLTCVGFSFAQEDKNEGVNAQEDKNEGIKSPSRQQSKPAAVKPEESKPDQPAQQEPSPGKPAHEDRHVQDQTKEQPRAQEKNAKQEKKEQEEESKRTQKEQRNDQNDQRVGQEQNRNAGNGRASGDARKQTARIPEEKFRVHFGREHHFRVSQ